MLRPWLRRLGILAAAAAALSCGARTDIGAGAGAGGAGDCPFDARHHPAPVTDVTVKSVAVGGGFACALLGDGAVRCWGTNCHGQLGDGTRTGRAVPDLVRGLPPVSQVVAAGVFACAITTDGRVACWGGYVRDTLLGEGGDALEPVFVPGLAMPVELAAGEGPFVCAREAGGSVPCWGADVAFTACTGGDVVEVALSGPTVTPLIDDADAVWVGQYGACADRMGVPWCWGCDSSGSLGVPPSPDGSSRVYPPVAATLWGQPFTSMANGFSGTCVVTHDEGVSCAGLNIGAFGNGSIDPVITPTAVPTPGDPLALLGVTQGDSFGCVLSPDQVVCSGRNDLGQLGRGTPLGTPADAPVLTYAPVIALPPATQISTGLDTTCAAANGQAWCWGQGDNGQLGDGTTVTRSTPAPVVF